jgi:hypothetical protein
MHLNIIKLDPNRNSLLLDKVEVPALKEDLTLTLMAQRNWEQTRYVATQQPTLGFVVRCSGACSRILFFQS